MVTKWSDETAVVGKRNHWSYIICHFSFVILPFEGLVTAIQLPHGWTAQHLLAVAGGSHWQSLKLRSHEVSTTSR
jgi:hypothetical protein